MYKHQLVARQPLKHAGVHGFNVWAVSLNLLLVGALLVMALRVVPSYMESLTAKDLIARTIDEYDPPSESVSELKVRLAKLLNTNQIYDTSIDHIEGYRERGAIVIDANYEKRFPVFWILDGVMKFEDLIVETASTGRT